MGKEVKVTTGRLARINTQTIVGDTKEADVPKTIEKHEEIRISDFDLANKGRHKWTWR